MESFTHDTDPARIVFGAGQASKLGDEVERFGCTRALVFCAPGRTAMVAELSALLGDKRVAVCGEARMHVLMENAEIGRAAAWAHRADSVVSIGGGSATGLGKAIALECDIPLICVVTTYSGSEMTAACGMV